MAAVAAAARVPLSLIVPNTNRVRGQQATFHTTTDPSPTQARALQLLDRIANSRSHEHDGPTRRNHAHKAEIMRAITGNFGLVD